jgi:ubiquinone/menaquinone biosynthesis C-methylase UbiE
MRLFDADRLAGAAMALTLAGETCAAFDSVAEQYHVANVANPILSAMRRRTIDTILRHLRSGQRVLDLGCGPGTDAVAVAATANCFVTAIDASPRMVAEAQRRVALAGLSERVEVRSLAIDDLDRLGADPFDLAYSDFGPLNCVDDLPAAAAAIARRLKPGGVLVASVIGRICPWELALYTSRRDFARARVRFARSAVPVPLNGHTVWTRYYTPGEFAAACRPAGFARVSLRGLGILVPPPYLAAFATRHARLVGWLEQVDALIAAWPLARTVGDHFLMVLRRG